MAVGWAALLALLAVMLSPVVMVAAEDVPTPTPTSSPTPAPTATLSLTGCVATTSGNWSTVVWSCGHVPTTSDPVLIGQGRTVTVNVANAVAQSVDVGANPSNGDGALIFNSGAVLTIGTSARFGSSVPPSTSGALTMTSGGTLKVGGAFTLEPGGLSTFTAGLGTIEYTAAGPQAVAGTTYNHLTTSVGGVKTLAGDVTVGGNLAINGSSTIASNGFTIDLKGNYTANGGFTPGTALVSLTGSADQFLIGGGFGSRFYDLTVNKPGGKVVLNSTFTVGHTVALMGGNIDTTSHLLIIPQGASISRSTGHVFGSISGGLQMHVGAGDLAPITFHLGTATAYTPLTVDMDGAGGGAGFLRASTLGSAHPNEVTSGLNVSRDIDRYWRIASVGASLGTRTYKLKLDFVSSDAPAGANPNLFEIRRWDGASWNVPVGGVYTRTAASTQYSNLTSFSEFIVGELLNTAPNDPSALGQFRADGTTTIPLGGFTNETTVVLKGSVSDPNVDPATLQVEVKPVGVAFDGSGLVESSLVGSGSTATTAVSGLTAGTGYHWRARTKDAVGTTSNWVTFGVNADPGDADFLVDTLAPTGTISINSGAAFTNSPSATLALSCTDTGSGCAEMAFSDDSGVYSAYAAISPSTSNTLPGPDGLKTVYVKYRDTAGNVGGPFSDTITLDTTPPVVSALSPAIAQRATTFEVTASVADTLSGVGTVAFTLDGGTPSAMAYVSGKWRASTSVAAAGVYDLCVRASDVAGNVSAACGLLAVYDPNGGFVTGGGWISVDAGDCTLNTLCQGVSGRGTFNFVSRYLPGRQGLSGNTRFHLEDGAFDFTSTSYEVLVVSGATAQYRGQGTINGAGVYDFTLWATDGDLGGGQPDRFRIRIGQAGGGAVVFDNVRGGGLNLVAAGPQGIRGGSTDIHK